MPEFTIYHSNSIGNKANCLYPHKVTVTDEMSFKKAVSKDHICAKFQNDYRSEKNFISADCIQMDCDNTFSDNPVDWKLPEDVENAFPNVMFAVCYSRNHMKEKNGTKARPRFHCYFPTTEFTDAVSYRSFKKEVQKQFPYFDENALDASRFFFGTDNPNVEIISGTALITDMISEDTDDIDSIMEGSRNSTLSQIAGRIIKRYGNTEEAHQKFLSEADRCVPPLEESELNIIWKSAQGFAKRISEQDRYIPPEYFNYETKYKPRDYSDVGQAEVLASVFDSELLYNPSNGYMRYNSIYWDESNEMAQAAAQELTNLQMEEAEFLIEKAKLNMQKTEATELIASVGIKRAEKLFTPDQRASYQMYKQALEYRSFVIKRRDSKNITATLKEARPMLYKPPIALDANGMVLNTPTATYELSKGLLGAKKYFAEDYITKVTAVSPSNKGSKIWQDALNLFFCNDTAFIQYVQRIVGLAAIGKVYVEALIIAYGEGRNGKSTFWNTISRVLGSYSGNISADSLTVGCRRNVKPELAEAKGKRLLIAAELEEGTRLNTANVKQFCSTDEIFAEKKYKDPFKYIPSHTLVLYTNHLPKVGANDPGTWRRLIVIPFNAKIEGNDDYKNYSEYLFENAGGAVLSWIIEGARMVINEKFKIEPPECVKKAIDFYRQDNDWLSQFLSERCEISENFKVKSGELYSDYRSYCMTTGDYTRSTTDFYTAIELAGFSRHRDRSGRFVKGLKIKSDFLT